MNSNRMKYATTPTYGMQKRGFAKKQGLPQAGQTPDFTKTPQPDFSAATPQSVFPYPQLGAQPSATAPAPFAQTAQPLSPLPNLPIGAQQPMAGMPSAIGSQPLPTQPVAPFAPIAQGFVPPRVTVPGSQLPPLGAQPSPYAAPYPTYPMGSANAVGAPQPGVPAYGNAPGFPQQTMYPPVAAMGGAQPQQGVPVFNSQPLPQGVAQPPAYAAAPKQKRPRQPIDKDRFFTMYLFAFLPLLFLPCVLLAQSSWDFVRYIFIVLTVFGLGAIWYRQMYASTTRTTVSVIYTVLCIVAVWMLLAGGNDVRRTAAVQPTPTPTPVAQQALAAQGVSAVADDSAAEPAETAPSANVPLGESEAELRLATFMDYWSVNNIENMVGFVQPSWASRRENAAAELFNLLSNRTAEDYTFEGITGAANDSSRTVTMSANINKNNGKDPVRYRFMILMVKENGEWYVDPNSLATNDTVDASEDPNATPTPTAVPRTTVTPLPDAGTTLYYNAKGGKFYHADPECSSVDKRYLPLAAFQYGQLTEDAFKSLEPCLRCNAPTRP